MNVFTFTGALGQDSEVKSLPNGTRVCEFSVAVNSGYGDNQKTTWANCALFGKRAEGQLPEFLKKGTKVAVSGEMTLETWDNQSTGSKGSKVKVMVNTVDLIGDKQQQQQAPRQQQAPQPSQAPADDSFSDDIPF